MVNNKAALQAFEEVRAFIPNTRQDSIVVIEQALNDLNNYAAAYGSLSKGYANLEDKVYKEEQILEILKSRKVYIGCLTGSTFEQYNKFVKWLGEEEAVLTETEFNIIKEWLK